MANGDPDKQKPAVGPGKTAGAGATIIAILGGVAQQADDVGRAVLSSADDVGRSLSSQADDLVRIGAASGDDFFQIPAIRSPYAIGAADDLAALGDDALRAGQGVNVTSAEESPSLLGRIGEQTAEHAVRELMEGDN